MKQIKQIGKKIQEATDEKLSTFYLLQNISMAIQQGNAVCVWVAQSCPKSPPNTPNPELASTFHDELKAVYVNHLVDPFEEQNGLTR